MSEKRQGNTYSFEAYEAKFPQRAARLRDIGLLDLVPQKSKAYLLLHGPGLSLVAEGLQKEGEALYSMLYATHPQWFSFLRPPVTAPGGDSLMFLRGGHILSGRYKPKPIAYLLKKLSPTIISFCGYGLGIFIREDETYVLENKDIGTGPIELLQYRTAWEKQKTTLAPEDLWAWLQVLARHCDIPTGSLVSFRSMMASSFGKESGLPDCYNGLHPVELARRLPIGYGLPTNPRL